MQHTKRWIALVLIMIAGLLLAACSPKAAASTKVVPAKVEPIEGSDLKRVVLTEKAAERLDLRTAPVREELVVRTRMVGGEVLTAANASGNISTSGDPGRMWVRVRLSEGDMNLVDRSQPARVLSLDDEDNGEEDEGLEAEEDDGPFEDPEEGSGALYYAVDSAQHGLVPGQAVLVKLSLSGSGTPQKVVPYSAVLYDRDGQTWVYTNPEPLVYVRQPITIDYIDGDMAILLEGPTVDTLVVMIGVAELFGAETGVGK